MEQGESAGDAKGRARVTYRVIGDDDEGVRLDNYLARILKGVPRSVIYRILRRGEVRVNKGRAQPSYRLSPGDEVRIPPLEVREDLPAVPSSNLRVVKNLEGQIIYESDTVLVLNKPSGIAAHGGSGIEFGLIEALRALRPQNRFLELAHRLDKETSGCLVVAKRRSALRNLHEQFRQRTVKKRYLALVEGRWERKVNLIEAPLKRRVLRSGERRVGVDFKEGQPSATAFEVEEYLEGATLLSALPHTGRTHQIRVHCAYAGHPVGNDAKYGSEAFNSRLQALGLRRMFLHAHKISFDDPSGGGTIRLEAPPDRDLLSIIEKLRPL